MSFLTEYFDEYRQHPMKKAEMCRPENRWARLEGKWLDPAGGKQDRPWTDKEVQAFIKATMRRLRGESTYYNDYCGHLSPEFKTRPFKPREKRRRGCKTAAAAAAADAAPVQFPRLAIQDTELMKTARELYERRLDQPTLKPILTHFRINGYCRASQYLTGLSQYQGSIARAAYDTVRGGRAPRYQAHNGGRPRYTADDRQPLLDTAPFDGERLY